MFTKTNVYFSISIFILFSINVIVQNYIDYYQSLGDNKKQLVIPLIAFKRTSIEKDESLPVDKMDPLNPQLQYTFQNDCKNILNFVLPQIEDVTPFDALMKKEKSFNNIFIVKNGQHPTILKMALANKINIETFIILNSIFKFIPRFNNEINETVMWPEFFAKCKKYRPFLEYNVDKYTQALKKVLDI